MARMTRTREEIEAEKARKPRPDLIPGAARLAVGRVLAYGCSKHGRCTWTEAGTEQARAETHIASAERHIAALCDAYDALDAESGLPHLWHAAAQLLIAIDCMERAQDAAERTPAALPEGRSAVRSDSYPGWDVSDPHVLARAHCASPAKAVARAHELAAQDERAQAVARAHELAAQDEPPEGWRIALDDRNEPREWDVYEPDGSYRGSYRASRPTRAAAVALAHALAGTRS